MRYIFPILILIFLVACEDSPSVPPVTESATSGILVLNEGLFGQSNSGFTIQNLSNRETTSNPYFAKNGHELGDTGNSMVISGERIYVCVTNSNKVEVVSLTNFESLGIIDLGENGSPREIAVLNDSIIYVTSLYRNSVVKINTNQKTILKEITVGELPEGIILVKNKLFVANSNFGAGNTLSIIDLTTDSVVDEVFVGFNPRILMQDNNYVYAVCSGIYDETGRGGLYKINPASLVVSDSLIINGNPGESTYDGSGFVYIANNDGVHKVALSNLSENEIGIPLISGSEINQHYNVIYSLFFDVDDKLLYAGNPENFVQNGTVVSFDESGTKISEFNCGLNPGTILKFSLN